jgi:oligopeptidase B
MRGPAFHLLQRVYLFRLTVTDQRLLFLLASLLLCAGCGSKSDNPAFQEASPAMSDALTSPFTPIAAVAPAPEKRPVAIEQHGVTRTDDYAWLRDDNWQAVLRDPAQLDADIRTHLNAENAYYKAATDDLRALQETLVAEMRGRIKEDDSSVPAADGEFAYAFRFREGGEYPVYVRTARSGGAETILYDGDLEAEGEDFFSIAAVEHSPDHGLIAYGVDRVGSEYYELRVRRVASGEDYAETVPATGGVAVWAADSRSFYYVERDDNQRPRRVKRHFIGTDPADDLLVYEELDDAYFVAVSKSQSGEFIFIGIGNGVSSEYRFLRTDAERGTKPQLIAERLPDELYEAEHHGKYFYLVTNAAGAVDFKIVRAPLADPGRDNWEDWLAHRPGVYLSGIVPFKNHLIRLERRNALPSLLVSDYAQTKVYEIEFDEAAYSLGLMPGYEFDTATLRFTYESPSTPQQTYDFNLKSRERVLRKTREVPSGHNPALYAVERFAITAADGAEVPVTVVRLERTPVDGTAPLLLVGYGSYGITLEARFDPYALSLVDRGAIRAIAHVRGGAAKGRQWYLDGKLKKKNNSFSDFAAVAEGLQARGYGRRGETVISGGSAGGLLVAATLNLRPELFGGAIAAVPFVDVLNTISDAELPLTPPEWVEWGDPITDPEAFATIAAYSPYENIRRDVAYPPVLATAGLTDYRVTYWEPAKWIARLRAEARGGPFFLKMNMDVGHSGPAARFQRLAELAHDQAFALRIFGLTAREPISHKQDGDTLDLAP